MEKTFLMFLIPLFMMYQKGMSTQIAVLAFCMASLSFTLYIRKKKEKHFITPAQEIVPGIDGPKRKRDNLENPLKRKRIQNETLDKEEALRLYNLMKAGHKGSKSNVTTDYVKNKMEDISATDAQDETDDEVIINKQRWVII